MKGTVKALATVAICGTLTLGLFVDKAEASALTIDRVASSEADTFDAKVKPPPPPPPPMPPPYRHHGDPHGRFHHPPAIFHYEPPPPPPPRRSDRHRPPR